MQDDAYVAWIDATSNPFVVSHLWTASLFKSWQDQGATTLSAGIRLPLELDLSVRGRYAYDPYANRSVFPDPSDVPDDPNTAHFLDSSARREQETGVRVQLQRAFGEHVLLSARWGRTRSRSTADVFAYTRDLFGVSVRIGWDG